MPGWLTTVRENICLGLIGSPFSPRAHLPTMGREGGKYSPKKSFHLPLPVPPSPLPLSRRSLIPGDIWRNKINKSENSKQRSSFLIRLIFFLFSKPVSLLQGSSWFFLSFLQTLMRLKRSGIKGLLRHDKLSVETWLRLETYTENQLNYKLRPLLTVLLQIYFMYVEYAYTVQ